MAKNREPEKPVESESESGETETESESESEPEQNQPQVKKLSSISAATKSQPPSSSKPSQTSDDEESESESESDAPEPNVKKPSASKPIDEPKKSKTAEKPKSNKQATPVKSSGAKRPAEEKETSVKDKKRSKKKKVEPEPVSSAKGEDPKRNLFQRIFSEEDEIVILKGMLDYKSDPVANSDNFLEFIKKDLEFDVTVAQFKDKITRIKKKYERNRSLEIQGKKMNLTTAHQTKCYEWSKKVWCKENQVVNGNVVKKTPKSTINGVNGNQDNNNNINEVKSVDRDHGLLSSKFVVCENFEQMISMIGAELFEGGKEVGGEDEWKNIKVQEVELYLKKLDLMRGKTKLVMDVLKN